MSTVHDLSWKETSFRSKVKLIETVRQEQISNLNSEDRCVSGAAHSALSSTYYSVVTTAFATYSKYKHSGLKTPFLLVYWMITWFPLSLYSYWAMRKHSDHAFNLLLADMTADQCDVRQTILRAHHKYDLAYIIIRMGLMRNPLAPHTEGLLHIGLADIYIKRKDFTEALYSIGIAESKAKEIEVSQPLQAARIYRHCGDTVLLHNKGFANQQQADWYYEKAWVLAEGSDANDQLLKLP
jgi:hypothetical protein